MANGASPATVLTLRLRALPEPRMRHVVLAETLRATDAATAVALLQALLTRARVAPTPACAAAVQAVSITLGDEQLLPYEVRKTLYVAAKQSGAEDLAALFFGTPNADDDRAAAAERPLRPGGRPLTLGERKSAARGHRRDELVHLLRDPHPDVIRILLGNPHITERDVVGIASRRPIAPSVLEAVFAAAKWRCRYAVRRALAMNPNTPLPLGIRLLPTLRGRDVREIGHDATLTIGLREHAQRLSRPAG